MYCCQTLAQRSVGWEYLLVRGYWKVAESPRQRLTRTVEWIGASRYWGSTSTRSFPLIEDIPVKVEVVLDRDHELPPCPLHLDAMQVGRLAQMQSQATLSA